jgi:hypothetical protein
MSHNHDWASTGTYLFAGVSGVSITVGGLSLIAIVISILSGLMALFLGTLKAIDWFEARRK